MAESRTVEYPDCYGCPSQEVWLKTPFFCLFCGVQSVWREEGEGDYYVGSDYLCVACDSGFWLPGDGRRPTNDHASTRLECLGER